MPKTVQNVPCFTIIVDLTGRTFDIQAGFDPSNPAFFRFVANGGDDKSDVALLTEVLGKIVGAYPKKPISLCVRDPDNDPVIVLDAKCAEVKAGVVGEATAAEARELPCEPAAAEPAVAVTAEGAPRAVEPETATRMTTARRESAPKKGAPRKDSPKKAAAKKQAPKKAAAKKRAPKKGKKKRS
jgi:hypothetical protein